MAYYLIFFFSAFVLITLSFLSWRGKRLKAIQASWLEDWESWEGGRGMLREQPGKLHLLLNLICNLISQGQCRPWPYLGPGTHVTNCQAIFALQSCLLQAIVWTCARFWFWADNVSSARLPCGPHIWHTILYLRMGDTAVSSKANSNPFLLFNFKYFILIQVWIPSTRLLFSPVVTSFNKKLVSVYVYGSLFPVLWRYNWHKTV